MSELTKRDTLEALARAVAELRDQARAPQTRRAYAACVRAWQRWCDSLGHDPTAVTARAVELFLASLARPVDGSNARHPSTLSKYHAALVALAHALGLPTPTDDGVKRSMAGARRSLGVAPRRRVRAILEPELRAMLTTIDRTTFEGRRDHALLLVGYLGAFRRSTLVALDVHDVELREHDAWLTIRREKTDQEAQGRRIRLPEQRDELLCPMRALREYVRFAHGLPITEAAPGALWRHFGGARGTGRVSDRHVARLVQRCARKAGLDPTQFAGHSLRAGFVTQATLAHRDVRAIMRKTGHRSVSMLATYTRDADELLDDAADGIFGTESTKK